MAHKASKQVVLLRLAVRSDSPSTDTPMLLDEIAKARSELKRTVAPHPAIQNASVRRRGNLPIGMETAVITILVTVGTEVGKEILKKAADDVYKWLKGRWEHGKFRKLGSAAERKRTSAGSQRRKARSR